MKKLMLLFVTLIALSGLALTPAERKMVATIRAEVEDGQKQYAASQAAVAAAKQDAADSKQHAADTDVKLVTAQKQFDAVNKDNQRMKPVFDQVNKHWGLGAFAYGFKILGKHLLILGAVILALVLVCIGLSIAFPFLIPIFSSVFHIISTGFRLAGDLLEHVLSILAGLFRPKPAPPAPPPAP